MKDTKRIPKWQNPNKKISYAGIHIVADFWFGSNIEDPRQIKNLLLGAAKESLSTPLKVSIHKFSPQGITAIVLLAESHIAIHSWPEIHYLAVDIFTCGKNAKPNLALEHLRKAFQPKKVVVRQIKRGALK